MATSPSFNWPEPDNTDLVKNGALAIRTAVDAIDTSMTDLLGGTTGQVLSKASATDMDFTWTTPSSGSTYVAGKNGIINGAMDIWQRGTSFTSGSAAYRADRWYSGRAGAVSGGTWTRQSSGLTGINYCMRVARDSGNTATNVFYLSQSIETLNALQYAGQTVTVSFYARKGANYSQSSGLDFSLSSGTGTDQNVSQTWTGNATVLSSTADLTTSWARYSASGSVASTATELGLNFQFTPSGTAGAADYFEITGVQVEIAFSASTFSRNAATIQGELAACQRYYTRWTGGDLYSGIANGTGISNTAVYIMAEMPVTMRAIPTSVDFSGIAVYDGVNAQTAIDSVTLTGNLSGTKTAILSISVSSGLTTYRYYQIINNNNSNGYLGLSAEL